MKKYVTRVFTVVKESFYGPDRYQRIARGTASSGIKYAFLAAVFTMLPFVGMAAIGLGALFTIDTSREAIDHIYPEGLEVTIKDGVVSTNVEEPYYLRSDEMSAKFGMDADDVSSSESMAREYLLVIDTTRPLTMDDVAAYDAHVVLGAKTLYVQKDESEMRSYDLANAENMTINENMVASFMDAVRPFLYVGFLLIVLTLALFFVLFCGIYYLALAAPAALVVKLLGKMQGFTISYGGAYAVSLYAMVGVALIGVVLTVFGFGGVFLINLLMFSALIIINMKPMPVLQNEHSTVQSPQA